MIPPCSLSKQQKERLEKAHTEKSYGHLLSWKELFLYQCTIADNKQNKEIAAYARRNKEGETITLPLAYFEKQEMLPFS